MKKKVWALGLALMMVFALSACGAKEEAKPANAGTESAQTENASQGSTGESASSAQSESRTITYLDKEYTVPTKVEKIVITGSVESMEDALVLDVKPVGAMTTGGQFAPMFAKITEGAEGIGEKSQPNIETILKLKPDVILASTKFPAEALEKLNKVTTTIPVSHIATDWEANLNLLAELTDKQEQAKQALQKYNDETAALKEKIGPIIKDKNVLTLRVRAGSMFIYPEDVFFNPSVYADLGATVPEEVKQAKAQQNISIEKLSEINPDYLFVQFSETENKDTPKVLEDLQNNPIWKSINAVKNDNLFVNLVDPTAQGGTAYSKIAFLEAVKNSKLVQAK
ncbi:ABC transporter substrate-binding protein [Paenibacillus apiarius]|uniref:ABC transporter substrate-binding protein n=1 Tax=Paenibacillus apiarius TaxID=46240 RepID=A0ABT4DZK8_9BACL|nr:ABC transporter substrate-binding protein [Paenibacillus apiarius]MCY9513225.1 ABC transporter substrate-binding protein [Paenibacillus apiarius]MCY9521416.1 ABC transporter substrate-binding protein [Paenibacillus apiarius]MCY9554438.1 ABC transporter substrate-binding protein [Paenibacillus apiarius]MCY9560641.1 ABC transporter substrate-binding protein [Paenibacillus apiarius]MCY9685108.1 ABC transporter substrate-binding protein [Paenibacillus apiarius]